MTTMYFHNICTKRKCYFGSINVTGPDDDDFVVSTLLTINRGVWVDVLFTIEEDEMAELRVILRQFRRHPEWYEEEDDFYG